MKLFLCDTETTDAQQPRLTWQLCYMLIDTHRGILINPSEILIGVPESAFKPKAKEMKDEVLEGRTDLKFVSLSRAYTQLCTNLRFVIDKYDKKDKAFFCAYNANFDDDNIRAIFKECNDNYYGSFFYWPPIDIASFALIHLRRQRHTMKDFKQGTVAKALGIEVDESRLHNAEYDLELLWEITKKVWPNGGLK